MRGPALGSILSQIKPEAAETIAAEAQARGPSVDDYLDSLLPAANGDAEKTLSETAKPSSG
jgi:hypothetical protein